jgi:RNA 2',3'-cyclic 3'-phosphodiesterase
VSRFSSPRLFVALRFSDDINEALDDIAFGIKGASWSPGDQYHLTLRFIGDPGSLHLDDVDRALREVRAPAFRIDLKGTGHFPLRGDPETLWAGVDENAPLASLRNRVEAALVRAGIAPEGRKFHPHVTLANVKAADPRDVGRFQVMNGLFRVNDVTVTEFHLCSSVLRESGAEHTVEESYSLESFGEVGG